MNSLIAIYFLLLISVGAFGFSQEPEKAKPSEVINTIAMKFVLVQKGTFTMGSPGNEANRSSDEVLHEVTISNDFFLGVCEVTQSQYSTVMGINPSDFQDDSADPASLPVDQVSWEDAVKFCKQLSELPKERSAGRVYRLPTEAEWEYACRAGSKTAFCFGDDAGILGDYAWCFENSKQKTNAVGTKKPNLWGLYDMHGNVWEFCSDGYGDYSTGPTIDPKGKVDSKTRVLRGGGWFDDSGYCRSAFRLGLIPSDFTSRTAGFRVVLDVQERTMSKPDLDK